LIIITSPGFLKLWVILYWGKISIIKSIARSIASNGWCNRIVFSRSPVSFIKSSAVMMAWATNLITSASSWLLIY
jgi:hypothetical protein